MRLQHVVSFVSIITIAQAWPWPPSFGGDAIEGVVDLFKRQENGGNNNNNNNNPVTSGGQITSAPTTRSQGGNINSNSNQGTGTITGTVTRATNSGNATSSTEFDLRDPAGGISMITPNPTLGGAQLYRIGDWVHFAWNYTSLQAPPNAINVVASCSQNQATYTLATNQSYQETGEVHWDTGNYQQTASQELLTNQYTLIVYDAEGGISQTPRAGYLGAAQGLVFGMYTPQPYTPWKDFNCPTCNGAISSMEKMTLGFLFGMASITVLTFSWFVTSLHII